MSNNTQNTDMGLWERINQNQALINQLHRAVAIVVLGLVLIWLFFPILWALETSLKTRAATVASPPIYWGFDVQWQNFILVWTETALPTYIFNGLFIATVTTILSLILGVPHAYAISMYQSRLGDASLLLVTITRIVPPITILVPIYFIFSSLNLINTKVAIIIAQTAFLEPFVVWIVKGSFDSKSRSLIDSARTDGCTKFQAFYKIMIPVSLPGILSATTIAWLLSWTTFLSVFLLATGPQAQTVPVGVFELAQDTFTPWNLISAAAIIGIIPSLAIVTVFQKYIIRGLVEQ
jgi:multiple sugar transport system permease protein